ncbi:hypothetical protein [Telluribacter sp.]|jgi:peroxiredoxin|uniref:peroxiredoxin family protein n=1 Tax=Telluribacter sp. TaxID=1978767 RepID=UPI002E1675B5|nr:hypothetical protein [Telluribacter sp.]
MRILCLSVLLALSSQLCFAQYGTTTRIDPSSKLYDKATGQPLPYKEFEKLMRADPTGYVFIPFYDKYGQLDYHSVHKKTKEERETNYFNPFDEYEKQKVGQPVAPFVMKGVDDKVYSSSELKGSYVLLSFWLKLSKPHLSTNLAKDLGTLLTKAAAKGIPVISLGVVNYSSAEECRQAVEEFKLSFIPIPDSKGFVHRYALPNSPSFLLISPEGTVMAISEGESPLKLEKYLTKKN